MATALRTPQPKPTPRRQPSRSRQRVPISPPQSRPNIPATVVPLPPRGNSHPSAGVRQLPNRRPIPLWLRLLIHLQRGSVIVTFVLVTAALVVYGSTIYMQQHWSKEYNKLKSMQRNERKMVAAGELMKNQLIQQAEQPGSGLVPRTAAHTVVIEPQPLRSPVTTTPMVKVEPSAPDSQPLGY